MLDFCYSYYPKIKDKVYKSENTISIHIRRSDYLVLQHAHVLQPISYYKRALETLSTKLGLSLEELRIKYELVIFSDDIGWCKEQEIFNNYRCKFMEPLEENVDLNVIIDLYSMAECEHNIIANSSFSWWGSYLNRNKEKVIIAPKNWFASKGPKDWRDIYTSDMIII